MSEWSDWPWVVASYLLTGVGLAAYAVHIVRRLTRARLRLAQAKAPREEHGDPRPGPWNDDAPGPRRVSELAAGPGQEVRA